MPVQDLSNLPPASNVLLDANIFVYAFSGQSAQCLELLTRCATEDVIGVTTVEVVNEVCHRMMLAEAVAKGVITRARAVDLKGKVADIRGFTEYWLQTARIFSLNILVLGLAESRIRRAQHMRTLYGLLTNDSVILAAADEYGIDCLATKDGDFDHVSSVRVYKPTDLP